MRMDIDAVVQRIDERVSKYSDKKSGREVQKAVCDVAVVVGTSLTDCDTGVWAGVEPDVCKGLKSGDKVRLRIRQFEASQVRFYAERVK